MVDDLNNSSEFSGRGSVTNEDDTADFDKSIVPRTNISPIPYLMKFPCLIIPNDKIVKVYVPPVGGFDFRTHCKGIMGSVGGLSLWVAAVVVIRPSGLVVTIPSVCGNRGLASRTKQQKV